MTVSVSELKNNAGRYITLADKQDVFITRNGKQVAKIVSTRIDRVAAMKSIFGVIPPDADLELAKWERLS